MSNKPDKKHLTVLGFAGQKTSSTYAKAGKLKLEKVKENVVDARSDFSSALSKTIEEFKAESVLKINNIDTDIAGLKIRMTSAGDKIGAIYKDEIIRIEHSKTLLLTKLEEFKDEGEDKWADFKNEFLNDLQGFNKAIKDFVENFKKQ